MKRIVLLSAGLMATLWLAACAGTGTERAAVDCRNCGEIVAIDRTRLVDRGGFGSGAGTLADGGRLLQAPDLSTLPNPGSALSRPTGALSIPTGNLAGAAPTARLIDIVDIAMDDGSRRRVAVDASRAFRLGERVRVVGGQLLPAPPGS